MVKCQYTDECEYESMEPADDIIFCAFHCQMALWLFDIKEKKD